MTNTKKQIFLVLAVSFLLGFAAPALAKPGFALACQGCHGNVHLLPPDFGQDCQDCHPYSPPPPPYEDPETPAPDDPNCKVCHGRYLGGDVYGVPMEPVVDSLPTSATLRNEINFTNNYVLEVMEIESSSTTLPVINFGNVYPGSTFTEMFYTSVFSNARYHEKFSWSDFQHATLPGVLISQSNLTVKVNDGSNYMNSWVGMPFIGIPQGGQHPNAITGDKLPADTDPGTYSHAIANGLNWEQVWLYLDVPGNAPAGIYNCTIDIKFTQI